MDFYGIIHIQQKYLWGDTGSLSIGAVISVIAIIVRKELLIPLLCGVFFIETLSVIMQVSYFKYTRTKDWYWTKNIQDGTTASPFSETWFS